MPLPPALEARLLKRGLLKDSRKATAYVLVCIAGRVIIISAESGDASKDENDEKTVRV